MDYKVIGKWTGEIQEIEENEDYENSGGKRKTKKHRISSKKGKKIISRKHKSKRRVRKTSKK